MTYHGSEGCQGVKGGTQGAPAAAGGAKLLPPGGQSYFLSNGWSKSIVLENKVAINFDFRSGAKKSGHLDYPLQSYGPKFVNICKYFDSVVPAHHPMQYLGELLFFHTPLYIRGVWKNINSPKYYIGWCARATEQSFNFFRK